MSDTNKFSALVDEIWEMIFGTPRKSKTNTSLKGMMKEVTKVKPKRARSKKGKFKADDKSTKHVNEAWVGGKAPAKKSKVKRKK